MSQGCEVDSGTLHLRQIGVHMWAREELIGAWQADLKALDVHEGDCLLVRSDLRFVRPRGLPRGARPDIAGTMLDALVSAVGSDGTVLMPTFTWSYVAGMGWTQRSRHHVFDDSIQSETGVLTERLLTYPGAIRSSHPTNSFVGIGRDAHRMLRFHDAYSSSFRPVEDLVNHPQGKMLLIGCTATSPGFSTTHLAELHLGLSHDSALSGKIRVRYVDPYRRVRVFKKRDIPGCSTAFGLLYDSYRERGLLKEGNIGGARSMLTSAEFAYRLDLEILAKDSSALTCKNPKCVHCSLDKSASLQRRLTFTRELVRYSGARFHAEVKSASLRLRG